MLHGDNDQIQPYARGKLVADITGAEFVTFPGGGHNPLGRYPAKCNALITDFLERRLGIKHSQAPAGSNRQDEESALSLLPRSGSVTGGAISLSRGSCASCIPICRWTGWPRTR